MKKNDAKAYFSPNALYEHLDLPHCGEPLSLEEAIEDAKSNLDEGTPNICIYECIPRAFVSLATKVELIAAPAPRTKKPRRK